MKKKVHKQPSSRDHKVRNIKLLRLTVTNVQLECNGVLHVQSDVIFMGASLTLILAKVFTIT